VTGDCATYVEEAPGPVRRANEELSALTRQQAPLREKAKGFFVVEVAAAQNPQNGMIAGQMNRNRTRGQNADR
jgi:hypothetical protein